MDHLWIGPLMLNLVDHTYLGETFKAGAFAAGYLFDPVAGEWAADSNGNVYQLVAHLPITTAVAGSDTTAVRQLLSDEVVAGFVNMSVIDETTEVTVIWSDWTPPSP